MSSWEQFLAITKKLDDVVHDKELKRSQQLEQLEDLLAQREALIYELPQPSEQEKPLLEEVKKRDLKINQKLEFLFAGLKMDIKNSKKQKSSKKQYTNPYQSVSNYDGMFLDHKK